MDKLYVCTKPAIFKLLEITEDNSYILLNLKTNQTFMIDQKEFSERYKEY